MGNNKKQIINAVKKAIEGNPLGAVKEALKSKEIRKKIKRKLILIALKCLPVLIAGIVLFSIFQSITDKMIQLLSSISTSVSGLWQWITDDYWIDLGEEIEYTDENGKIENYTLVDKYIKELGNMGISLESLRLLGEANYTNEETLLENNENKKLVEKYIAEFIRADLITQEFHKRRGNELVNPNNQNKIDGGVYLYRSKKEATITEDEFVNGNYEAENVEVTDKDYIQMEYIDIEEFQDMVAKNDKNIRYKYSIDRDTGELLVGKVTTTWTIESDISNNINAWFADLYNWMGQYKLAGNTTYEIEEVRIAYKDYISKYTMPYEFLINLCEITQNPEFVYHVALLARDSNIVLAIQDDTTIERETIEIEEDRLYYKNTSGPSSSGASTSDPTPKTKKTRRVTTVTTQNPILTIEYADTWSFYEEFNYTKNISGTLTEEGPIIENPNIPSTLSGYQPARTEISYDPADGSSEGVGIEVQRSEYWYDTFVTQRRTETQMITTTTTYNEPILENSVEKSKQFLGLLRNNTGKCPYSCFENEEWTRQNPVARYCSKEAVFKRNGINVQYKIPNIERVESPLNKLTSGLEMLYATMQVQNSGADKTAQNYNPDEDYESIYNQKMQGLVDHMKYLMTYPENESYTVKDLLLDILPWNDDEYEEEIISGYEFWWPLDENVECRISSYFGKRTAPTQGASTYHEGIDIARPSSGENIEGTAIIASADGIVEISKYSNSAGNYIVINHENGYKTRYLHNASNIVSVGDRVSRGQVIGYLGNTGNSTGPHLHFEILLNGVPQNPLNYVSMKNKRPEGTSVTVDDETKKDIIYAVVASECSSSYEGSLAVITCVLNRCNSSKWSNYGGSDPYLQITATGQFSYGIPQYANHHKKYLNGKVPEHVKRAVNDALQGKRNHHYTSFRTDSAEARRIHPNGESIGGNWYF